MLYNPVKWSWDPVPVPAVLLTNHKLYESPKTKTEVIGISLGPVLPRNITSYMYVLPAFMLKHITSTKLSQGQRPNEAHKVPYYRVSTTVERRSCQPKIYVDDNTMKGRMRLPSSRTLPCLDGSLYFKDVQGRNNVTITLKATWIAAS